VTLAEDEAAPELRPNLAVLIVGTLSIGVVSAATLSWPQAMLSTVLGMLMISGAEIDARTLLLPDLITLGAAVCGIAAAPLLDPTLPLLAVEAAAERAALTGVAVALLRWCYGALRGREGLGWGDVKLAATIGAWLPFDAVAMCFALATAAALIAVGLARVRSGRPHGVLKVPFGAFLCPALWLSLYAQLLAT
jgi:leader peptidase (prepilin peptidase)/N-methyltransferase